MACGSCYVCARVLLQENSPSKKACPMVQNMLEECDSPDEDSVLFVISQDCTIQERVCGIHVACM